MIVKRTPMDSSKNPTGPTETGELYFSRGPSSGQGYDANLGNPNMYFQSNQKGTLAQRVSQDDLIEPV